MLILKRLAVWLLETLGEATLLSGLLYVLAGTSFGHDFSRDLLFLFIGTSVVFMWGHRYLFTTVIFGVIWRSQRRWLYPTIAAALFAIHVQFYATGWTVSLRLLTQFAGACIVFACTFLGNCLLRKWAQHAGVPDGVGQ